MGGFEIIVLILLTTNIALLAVVLLRMKPPEGFASLQEKVEGISIRVSEGFAATYTSTNGLREEFASGSRLAREELANRLDATGANLTTIVTSIGSAQGERLDGFARGLTETRTASEAQAKLLRQELVTNFEKLASAIFDRLGEQTLEQNRRLDSFAAQLNDHRNSAAEGAKSLREELTNALTSLGTTLVSNLQVASAKQAEGLSIVANSVKEMTAANEAKQETLKHTVELRLDAIRAENAGKLEEMRATVDEKLQSTLEARLGASFTQVNENLERVYKSVGEMQTIASGVGDLKRVLTNVKSRGTWGEVTLGLLLEQVMTPEQYSQNVEVRPNSGLRVEFAIKLPGEGSDPIWLPIDAKMPTEDYERLVEASERGDGAAVDQAIKGIERAIKLAAKDIRDKYICPPHSTDFAMMFLPNEGIYAEVLRRPGLVDTLQREFKVHVAGPTNLMAVLTAFRMSFRTLAIQERSSEVWKVLGRIKHEFGKFGVALDKVQKKLSEAQGAVKDAGVRSRAVSRELEEVEMLPGNLSEDVLAIPTFEVPDDGEPAEAQE